MDGQVHSPVQVLDKILFDGCAVWLVYIRGNVWAMTTNAKDHRAGFTTE